MTTLRWRFVLLLVMLTLSYTCAEDDEEDNQETEDDDEDDESEQTERTPSVGRRAPPYSPTTPKLTRTTKKRPLECFVCMYKRESAHRSCLDPTKYNVNTETCPNLEEKCFTSVETKDTDIEMVVRGCRSTCVGSPDVSCCGTNRCNNQPFAAPVAATPVQLDSNAYKALPHTILFFVTVLLVLQTVVKVNIL